MLNLVPSLPREIVEGLSVKGFVAVLNPSERVSDHCRPGKGLWSERSGGRGDGVKGSVVLPWGWATCQHWGVVMTSLWVLVSPDEWTDRLL